MSFINAIPPEIADEVLLAVQDIRTEQITIATRVRIHEEITTHPDRYPHLIALSQHGMKYTITRVMNECYPSISTHGKRPIRCWRLTRGDQ